MKRLSLCAIAPLALTACGSGADEVQQTGAVADMPDPDRGFLPSMTIADPTAWGDRRPQFPEGFTVTAIAKDMAIPRQSIVLPKAMIASADGRYLYVGIGSNSNVGGRGMAIEEERAMVCQVDAAGCAACHRIAGTTANGLAGPGLTHMGSRRRLGAGMCRR